MLNNNDWDAQSVSAGRCVLCPTSLVYVGCCLGMAIDVSAMFLTEAPDDAL
jgi:hypothetical protein